MVGMSRESILSLIAITDNTDAAQQRILPVVEVLEDSTLYP